MTKTAEPEVELSPAELDAEADRLSYEVSTGNNVAAVKLARIEAQIEASARAARRAAGASREAERIAAAAAAQATLDAHAENERLRRVAFEAKMRTYSLVEQVTGELVAAVRLALDAGAEFRAAQLRLGYAAGSRLPSSEISDFLFWRLGRDGEDTAGLSDVPPVFPSVRQPLVPKEQ